MLFVLMIVCVSVLPANRSIVIIMMFSYSQVSDLQTVRVASQTLTSVFEYFVKIQIPGTYPVQVMGKSTIVTSNKPVSVA